MESVISKSMNEKVLVGNSFGYAARFSILGEADSNGKAIAATRRPIKLCFDESAVIGMVTRSRRIASIKT